MKLFQLLPLLSLAACGSAFEAGNLFPDDAGQPSPDGASHDAGTTAHDAAESDSHQNSSQDGGQTLDGPGDLQEAASAPETGPEAASEAAPPPECSAPRCVDGTTLQSCFGGLGDVLHVPLRLPRQRSALASAPPGRRRVAPPTPSSRRAPPGSLDNDHVPLRMRRIVLLRRLRSGDDSELLGVRELWHSDVPAERDVGAVLR